MRGTRSWVPIGAPARRRWMAGVIAALALTLGRIAPAEGGHGCPVEDPTRLRDPDTLRVGLYPGVPRIGPFEAALRKAWSSMHPDVSLDIGEGWDGGYDSDPVGLDVFVFDAMFLNYFQNEGYLAAFPAPSVINSSDIMPFALEGVGVEGTLYGIPMLANADLLYFRENDTAMAKAATLGEVVHAIGSCQYFGTAPGDAGTGLMVDFSDRVKDARRYLNALEQNYGVYTADPPLAPTNDTLDGWASTNLRKVLGMASVANGLVANLSDPTWRGELFGRGRGRALVGSTAELGAMGGDTRASVDFKLMPFSDRAGVEIVSMSVVGVNPCAQGRRRGLAVDLANLVTSTEVLVDSTRSGLAGPWGADPTLTPDDESAPQYFMPVRKSMFEALAGDRLYAKMHDLLKGASPRVFRIGANARQWLRDRRTAILNEIFNPPPCRRPEPREARAAVTRRR